jgi:hypothetical protein
VRGVTLCCNSLVSWGAVNSVALHEVIGISAGKQTDILRSDVAKGAEENDCFTLITPDIQLNLEVNPIH